ncbi:uncharacterized protein [Argopecten irradians]|uniref:uncharacterized protein n=1 Tax=Argopecten irradians TaxID=31199 RepID=UPI00371FB3EC
MGTVKSKTFWLLVALEKVYIVGLSKMVNTLPMLDNSVFGSYQYSCPKIKYKKRKRRHIPHSQRSPEYVLHRNTRERKRVEAMNEAFGLLRKHVPFIAETDDRASKAGILYGAAHYIKVLADILNDIPCTTSTHSDVILQERNTGGWYDNRLNMSIPNSGDQEIRHLCRSQIQMKNEPKETCMFMEIQHSPPEHHPHCLENIPPHIPGPRECLYASTDLSWQ